MPRIRNLPFNSTPVYSQQVAGLIATRPFRLHAGLLSTTSPPPPACGATISYLTPSTCVPINWSHHTANSCVSMKARTNGRSREGMASSRVPCVHQADPLPSDQVCHADPDPDPDPVYTPYSKVTPPSWGHLHEDACLLAEAHVGDDVRPQVPHQRGEVQPQHLGQLGGCRPLLLGGRKEGV